MGTKILTLKLQEYNEDFDVNQTPETTVHLPDDVAWDKMVPYFLHFLEGAGYIGVVDRISKLLGGDIYEWRTYQTDLDGPVIFNGGEDV